MLKLLTGVALFFFLFEKMESTEKSGFVFID